MRACSAILSVAVVTADRPDTNLLVSELRDFAQQVKDIKTAEPSEPVVENSTDDDLPEIDPLAAEEEEEEEGEVAPKMSLRGKHQHASASYDVPTVSSGSGGHGHSHRSWSESDADEPQEVEEAPKPKHRNMNSWAEDTQSPRQAATDEYLERREKDMEQQFRRSVMLEREAFQNQVMQERELFRAEVQKEKDEIRDLKKELKDLEVKKRKAATSTATVTTTVAPVVAATPAPPVKPVKPAVNKEQAAHKELLSKLDQPLSDEWVTGGIVPAASQAAAAAPAPPHHVVRVNRNVTAHPHNAMPTYRAPAPTAAPQPALRMAPQPQPIVAPVPPAVESFQVPAAENVTGPLPEPIVSESMSWFRACGVFLMAIVGIFFAVFHFANDAGEEYEKSTMAILLKKGGLDLNVQEKLNEVFSKENLDRVMPNAIAQRDFSVMKESARNMVKDLVARFNADKKEIKPLLDIDTDCLSDVPLTDSDSPIGGTPKFVPSGRSISASALAGSGSQRRSHSADYRVISPGAESKIFSHRGFVA